MVIIQQTQTSEVFAKHPRNEAEGAKTSEVSCMLIRRVRAWLRNGFGGLLSRFPVDNCQACDNQ